MGVDEIVRFDIWRFSTYELSQLGARRGLIAVMRAVS